MSEVIVRVVDAYVFRQTDKGIRFLLLKRAPLKIYEHLWQGVAGKIEGKETAKNAAVRELKEETGLKPINIFVADHVSVFFEDHFDRMNLVPVFGIEVKEKHVKLSKEHVKYKWVNYKTAYKMIEWNGQKKAIKVIYKMLTSGDSRLKWSKA